MRITAGSLKNKEVLSFKDKDKTVRPTSSKVREAVFNLLRHGRFLSEVDFLDDENPNLIENRVIADIFCGTGIVAFEALSRGASKVILVDQNDQSLQTARANAKSLAVSEKCVFLKANALQLPTAIYECDVIFLDPPYNIGILNPSIECLIKNKWLKKGGIIIAEHSKTEEVKDNEKLQKLDYRKYNNTSVTILKFLG
jgi:16S rRNA (guanine966-N2)-methyltransferase